jgi:hypothetical protein
MGDRLDDPDRVRAAAGPVQDSRAANGVTVLSQGTRLLAASGWRPEQAAVLLAAGHKPATRLVELARRNGQAFNAATWATRS